MKRTSEKDLLGYESEQSRYSLGGGSDPDPQVLERLKAEQTDLRSARPRHDDQVGLKKTDKAPTQSTKKTRYLWDKAPRKRKEDPRTGAEIYDDRYDAAEAERETKPKTTRTEKQIPKQPSKHLTPEDKSREVNPAPVGNNGKEQLDPTKKKSKTKAQLNAEAKEGKEEENREEVEEKRKRDAEKTKEADNKQKRDAEEKQKKDAAKKREAEEKKMRKKDGRT